MNTKAVRGGTDTQTGWPLPWHPCSASVVTSRPSTSTPDERVTRGEVLGCGASDLLLVLAAIVICGGAELWKLIARECQWRSSLTFLRAITLFIRDLK